MVEVFALVWPQAAVWIATAPASDAADAAPLLACVQLGALLHEVQVPRALLSDGRGLLLVRALFLAGLPAELASAREGRCCLLRAAPAR